MRGIVTLFCVVFPGLVVAQTQAGPLVRVFGGDTGGCASCANGVCQVPAVAIVAPATIKVEVKAVTPPASAVAVTVKGEGAKSGPLKRLGQAIENRPRVFRRR